MTTGVIYSRRAAAEAEEIKAFLTEHSPSAIGFAYRQFVDERPAITNNERGAELLVPISGPAYFDAVS